MTISEFQTKLNTWGQHRVPFLFIIDFEMESPLAWQLSEVPSNSVLYDLDGFTNATGESGFQNSITMVHKPVDFEEYKRRFDLVMRHLRYGDTFLTNLTIKTGITVNQSLQDLFYRCRAKYKLWFNDEFIVFSPETFVRINNSRIETHPMKGTIDANLPDAHSDILNNEKELSEHITIVDLLRNDLSSVATNVRVERFRYIDEVKTNHKNLLQVSSKIVGDLPQDYHSIIGDILVSLLPAGSVSGAPKRKTLDIIREAECSRRGYYTGVFGYFDGHRLDSAVMIRYIEKKEGQFYYRSGGGITSRSKPELEYAEALDKIYVPID